MADFSFPDFLKKIDPQFYSAEATLFCSRCKDSRVMKVSLWLYNSPFRAPGIGLPFSSREGSTNKIDEADYLNSFIPSMWECICNQCKTKHYLVVYPITGLPPKIILLSESLDGISTPITPDAVKYYLDQAYKAKMIGANSACIAMYRAALQQLLFEQGYITGMLDNQIKELINDKKTGKGKDWIKDIDEDLFEYIKKLGNGAIHPNGGDISKQQVLDDELIVSIDELFGEFLELIYEKPIKEAKRKALLLSKTKMVNK